MAPGLTPFFSYEVPDISLNCGVILRECIRHDALAKIILHSEAYYNFYDYVELSTFDVASDAFTTFKELMTKHKQLVADFLEANYTQVIAKYTGLLNSNNYVTKRQSLKVCFSLFRFLFSQSPFLLSSVVSLSLVSFWVSSCWIAATST